jgi:hypothetical protein
MGPRDVGALWERRGGVGKGKRRRGKMGLMDVVED